MRRATWVLVVGLMVALLGQRRRVVKVQVVRVECEVPVVRVECAAPPPPRRGWGRNRVVLTVVVWVLLLMALALMLLGDGVLGPSLMMGAIGLAATILARE